MFMERLRKEGGKERSQTVLGYAMSTYKKLVNRWSKSHGLLFS
jgi:hypothetical protein